MTKIIIPRRKPRQSWAEEVNRLYAAFYDEMHGSCILVFGTQWQPLFGGRDDSFDRAIWVRTLPESCRSDGLRALHITEEVTDAVGELTFEGQGYRFREDGFEYKIFDKCRMNPDEYICSDDAVGPGDLEDGGAPLS